MIGRLVSVVIVTWLAAGCYSYSEVTLDRVAPGSDVRARLSAAEAERARAHVPGEGRVFDGRFVGWSDDRILLEVPITRELRGIRVESLHQRLDIAAADIVELEVRTLDRTRTALMVGAGVAAAALFVVPRMIEAGRSPPDEGGEPGPEDRLVIRLTLPVGR